MLKLITGRAGSGKTRMILEDIKSMVNNKRRCYLILPEQQVYSAERSILPLLPSDSSLYFEILSFSRLAQKIALQYGGLSHTLPTKSSRMLLMWRNLRELSGLLEEYRSTTNTVPSDTSLTKLMLATVDELKYNGIYPSKLEKLADELEAGTPLAKKLRDIALISAAFDGLLEDIYGPNSTDRLGTAAKQLENYNFFNGISVFVDSFTSFTTQEYAILKNIMQQANDLTLALCVDKLNSDKIHFESTSDTANRLIRMASDLNIEFSTAVPSEIFKRNISEELEHLEDKLWSFDTPTDESSLPCTRGSIQVLTAENVYDESHATALNILSLIKSGVSYGDIAVIVRDVNTWRGILDAALEAYDIPYFISERTDLCSLPATRLLLCALRAIARHWQAQDVINLCKTGLCGISPYELDMFEEYVETWQLGGKKMTEDNWSMNPDGYRTEISPRAQVILETANKVRKKIMTPLISLDISLRAAENITDQCRAIYQYISSMSIKEQQLSRAEELISLNKIKEAGEELRLWTFLTDSLSTLATTMADDRTMSAEELENAFSILFSTTDIGSIPARHDCVIIGSAATLRVANIKAALLLGLCEGEFPASASSSGILTDSDKNIMRENGIELDSGSDMQSSEELLYVYRAMTTPSEYLFASHSLHNIDGKSQAPSVAFTRLRTLFPYLTAGVFRSSLVYTTEELISDRLSPSLEDSIHPITAKHLLGKKLYLTQSKIQKYFNCPYSYYGSYVLKLRERCLAKLDDISSGIFLHHVMESFLKLTLDEHNRIRPLNESEILDLANTIIEKYIIELCHGDIENKGHLIHVFGRMRNITVALLQSIIDELNQSRFVPYGFEFRVGGENHEAASMNISLDISPVNSNEEDLVSLIFSGVIDRVDIYHKDDKIYLRVVDYKSSVHELSEKAIVDKLNIQLLLYLFSLCSEENRSLFISNASPNAQITPASAVYVSPSENTDNGLIDITRNGIILDDNDILSAVSNDLSPDYLLGIKTNKNGELKGNALCSPERMKQLEEELYSAIRDTARKMYNGKADRSPSAESCRYCALRSSCFAYVPNKE